MLFEGLESLIVLSGDWEFKANTGDTDCYINVEEGSVLKALSWAARLPTSVSA